MSKPLSRLATLWLCEAIRLREEHTGPLEDSHINRQAMQQAQGFTQRLEYRAKALATRDGQAAALSHYQQGARLALWLLLLGATLSGAALAITALGTEGGTVNVFWVLGSLLGLNLLSLLAWLVASVVGQDHSAVLGRFWLWLSEKLARDTSAAHLTPALMLLLTRQGLLKWLLGSFTHGLWLVASLASCALLVTLLSTQHYGFVWETTLLKSQDFVALTHMLGAVPSWLGFSVPTESTIRLSGRQSLNDPIARQAWASWLMGVVLVWGVIPRLVLWLLCQVKSSRALKNLTLDLQAPGYQALRSRLEPLSQNLGISDLAPKHLPTAPTGQQSTQHQGHILLGVELDESNPWPPLSNYVDLKIVETREQRAQVLDYLSAHPAEFLCVVCNPQRSPDRGTLNLLTELAYNAKHTYIWLNSQGGAVTTERLADWAEALTARGLAFGRHAPEQPHV